MFGDSVSKTTLRFSHIQFITTFTNENVNKIGGSTGEVLVNAKSVVVWAYNRETFIVADNRASIASSTVARKSSRGAWHLGLGLRGSDQVSR